jgi:RES domain-containing protein
VRVFRLASASRADLSGAGSKRRGARCNRPGVAAVYCAQSIALCLLEILVHLRPERIPSDYVVMAIEVPDNIPVQRGAWQDALGSEGRNPVWVVPSVIVPFENNIVSYPEAAGYAAAIEWVRPFTIDERLLGRAAAE